MALHAEFLRLMTAELHGGVMPVQHAPLGPTSGEERYAIVGDRGATRRHAATESTWRAEAARRGDGLSVVLTDGTLSCHEWAGVATAEWVEYAASLIVQAMADRWSEPASYPWSCWQSCCRRSPSSVLPVRRCSGLVGSESLVLDALFTMCRHRVADDATDGVSACDRRRWQLEVARAVFDRPGTTVVVRAHSQVGVRELSQTLLELVNGRPHLHETPRAQPRFGWPVAQLVGSDAVVADALAAARTAGLVIVDAGGATDTAVEVLRARRRATSVLVLGNGDFDLDAALGAFGVGAVTDVVVIDVTTAGAASNVHNPSPAGPASWVIEF